jgi:hypothetical protein
LAAQAGFMDFTKQRFYALTLALGEFSCVQAIH